MNRELERQNGNKSVMEYEEALGQLLESTGSVKDTETVTLLEAGGRILSSGVVSALDQPPFSRSPLDGYAFRSEDTEEACTQKPVLLKLISREGYAGKIPEWKIGPGYAARIMTGAPIPEGADCVAAQETVSVTGTEISVTRPFRRYENYCFAGEDIRKGQQIGAAGEEVSTILTGAFASAGIEMVQVWRKPRIAVLSTGDELQTGGSPLREGFIYDSNGLLLQRAVGRLGGEVISLGIVRDEPDTLQYVLDQACGHFDAVISSGGVSTGSKDILPEIFGCMECKTIFRRAAIKPGSPVMAVKKGKTVFLSLPGNPYAAFATMVLFGAPMIRKLRGMKRTENTFLLMPVAAGERYENRAKVRRYLRAMLCQDGIRIPEGNHSSGAGYGSISCNCIVEIPPQTIVREGRSIRTLLLGENGF